MRFPPVPPESKNQINKAGKLLAKGSTAPEDIARAGDLGNRWRACHAYPLNTFQATLRTRLARNYRQDAIAAQRLKRMSTIIDKLRRYRAMQLTTMQDIAGVRAILESAEDVDRLIDEYKTGTRFEHELIDEKDYIAFPRSEDGYRSYHLIYRYRNFRNSLCDGLRVEMQVRTRLQHIWATAVETMGTFLGQALKSRQGDQEWIDFFAIVSSAFAYMEGRPLVPRFDSLTQEKTFHAVVDAEKGLGALDKMMAFSTAVKQLPSRSA